MMAFREY